LHGTLMDYLIRFVSYVAFKYKCSTFTKHLIIYMYNHNTVWNFTLFSTLRSWYTISQQSVYNSQHHYLHTWLTAFTNESNVYLVSQYCRAPLHRQLNFHIPWNLCSVMYTVEPLAGSAHCLAWRTGTWLGPQGHHH